MNEIVKNFIESKKAEEKQQYEKEKKATLIELGLYKNVYLPGKGHCKAVPAITDEEYQEIKKYLNTKNNPIARALTLIARVIFILGVFVGTFAGIILGDETEFSFAIPFMYWCISLISGTMFLGFAEIIKLLNDIKNK